LIYSVQDEDTFSEDGFRRAIGIRDVALLPVMIDDEAVGALALSSRDEGVYHAEHMRVLETFAGQLALAAAATNLRRDAEHRAAHAQFMATTAGMLAETADPVSMFDVVLAKAGEVLGDLNAVFLPDAAGALRLESLATVDSGKAAIARQLLSGPAICGQDGPIGRAGVGDSVLIPDFADPAIAAPLREDAARLGLTSLIASAMMAGAEVRGVFVSGRTDVRRAGAQPGGLTEDQFQLSHEFARLLGSALLTARLYEETRQALEQSEALRRIGQELAGSMDLDQILELVANFARLLLSADFTGVLIEESDRVFTLRAVSGTHVIDAGEIRYEFGFGLAGRAVAARRSLVVQGFPDNPEFPPEEFPFLAAERAQSALVTPLRLGDQILGALIVSCRTAHIFDAAQVQLAEALAVQAAIAVEHARLFAQARQAIDERDQFLSVAAHELRTPLTTLRGRVQLLQRRLGSVLTPAGEEALRVVLRQVDRLSRMVNDLLDVSRVQAGGLPLSPERLDLVDLVFRATQELDEATEGPALAYSTEEPELYVSADPWRLEQVMANLLSNARRFTVPDGSIRVSLARDGDQARVEVEDDGIGIEREHLERIFEPFYQIAAEPRVGVGLGLAICRQIVESHGGRLWVTSPGPGKGATFIMTLPLVA
jgi:signal transduction histidine kinase